MNTKYLVQQYYPASKGWVTEEECSSLEQAQDEKDAYRRVNQGRTRLRIVRTSRPGNVG